MKASILSYTVEPQNYDHPGTAKNGRNFGVAAILKLIKVDVYV